MRGTFRVAWTAQVYLYDFITVACACVADRDGQGEGLAIFDFCCTQGGVAVVESGVAQAVAEGKERSFRHVAVSTSLHRVVFKVGQLGCTLIKGDRKASRRVIVSEEGIGDGCTSCLAGIPCLKDGVACLCFWCQGDGRTGEVDEYDFLSRLL